LDFCVKIFESLAAVPEHRAAKGLQSLFTHLDGSRNVQFDVSHRTEKGSRRLRETQGGFVRRIRLVSSLAVPKLRV